MNNPKGNKLREANQVIDDLEYELFKQMKYKSFYEVFLMRFREEMETKEEYKEIYEKINRIYKETLKEILGVTEDEQQIKND